MLTEQDARQKWCPMVRNAAPSDSEAAGTAGNRYGGEATHPTHSCIASDCMMWRKTGQIGIGPRGEKRDRDLDGLTRWIDVGYCGLAGSPVQR